MHLFRDDFDQNLEEVIFVHDYDLFRDRRITANHHKPPQTTPNHRKPQIKTTQNLPKTLTNDMNYVFYSIS